MLPPRPLVIGIETLALTTLNTEYSWTVPANLWSVSFKLRSGNAFRMASVTGKVAGPTESYLQMLTPINIGEQGLLKPGQVYYFAAPASTEVLEIITYTLQPANE
jgi:hypothetical protein